MLPRLESNALLLSAGQLKIRIFLSSSKVQALREFLLLTSSDWPFLITEKQAEDYGAKRFREHAERFDRLMDYAEAMLDEEEPKVSERMKSSATSRMSARLIIHSPTSDSLSSAGRIIEGLEKEEVWQD